MPIPKWCDRKSIRTIKRGKATILICCPKGKTRAGKCSVGTRAIDVRSSKLIKGAKKEKHEHPWASASTARRIAADHLRENPRAYGAYPTGAPDPADLSAARINAEVDRLRKISSVLTDEFIAAGRGYERPSETVLKDDPLARRYIAISNRQHALRWEIERRYGPGAPSHLPRGFGPTKRY